MSHHSQRPGSQEDASEYELLPRSTSPRSIVSPPPPAEEEEEEEEEEELEPPKPPEPKRGFKDWTGQLLNTWLYEILAMIFSLLCFIAIACVLMVFDEKTQPSFAYGFTLNAVVSILATASKSSLLYVIGECIGQLKWIWFYEEEERKKLDGMQLFDGASRGPLGSLFLVFDHKGRSLVSLGALLTVLALAFDPFMQQILTYPTREVAAVRVTEGGAQSSDTATAKQAFTFVPALFNTNFQTIINTGVWSELSGLEPNVTCPSGNCDWEPFESVGMCSECEDVTSIISLECLRSFTVNTSTSWYDDDPTCSITSPSPEGNRLYFDVTVQPGGSSRDPYTHYEHEFPEHIVWSPTRLHSGSQNTTYAGLLKPQSVIVHAELGLTDDINGTRGFSPLEDLVETYHVKRATQCALALCSRTYNISVTNGTARIAVSAHPDYGELYLDPDLYLDLEPPYRSGWCWKPTEDGSSSSSWENTGMSNISYGIRANESAFAFCPADGYNLEPYLGGVALAKYTIMNATNASWTRDESTGYEEVAEQPINQNVLKIISSGIEPVISNVVASFTRAGLVASNHTVVGTVYSTQVYVSVHWVWLALPAALVVFSALFLTLTIVLNRQQRLKLWKSSVLAVLFHGLLNLGTEVGGGDYRTKTMDQMQHTAESIQVRLRTVDDEKGLMLDQS
ncbi:hypothetical protein BJY01DRAFT_251766 [Aspergillus pseudoustus]|uniref:Uncharacterized protein n=1 Tax=Aspergillus pseudoustus TaxID=1810923 RepID=A0ABR4JA15_9EURO